MTQELLRTQYERFPYPPMGPLALPRADQGEGLSYEFGTRLSLGQARSHKGIRILVAGAGTLEPLVVAQRHPKAAQIVAVDFSGASLDRLRKRMTFARIARLGRSLAPVESIQKDLLQLSDAGLGTFDYILASNLIHHFPNPDLVLRALKAHLSPRGLLRVVTYPHASRIWMRQVGLYLASEGLSSATSDLLKRARLRICALSPSDPRRLTFETNPESRKTASLVDAYLNAIENPLRPLELARAVREAGLVCHAESQTATSHSDFLSEICPELVGLSRWEKLQILDDLLELCVNPVLWFTPAPESKSPNKLVDRLVDRPENESEPKNSSLGSSEVSHEAVDDLLNLDGLPPSLLSSVRSELSQNLERIKALLRHTNLTPRQLLERFRIEVGPRVHPSNYERELQGLALSDYLR